MDRREFLRSIGKAGLAAGATGFLGNEFIERALAAEKMPFIKLSGTPTDMGRQYANQAGDLIKERIKWMHEHGTLVDTESIDQSRVFLDISAESVSDELRGLAAALDEKEQDIMILSAEPPGVSLRRAGCSSFMIDGTIAKESKPWVGENVDDAPALQPFGVIIVRHPLEGPALITWALAGGVGCIGFNSNGVALTMNYCKLKADKPPVAIYPEFVANGALRQPDFKNASALLTSTPLMKGCTFILSDAGGNKLLIERSAHIYRGAKPATPFVCATNHFQDPEFARDDDSGLVFPDSGDRLKRLNKLFDRKGAVFGEAELKKILCDTMGEPRGISRHADPKTIASLLMCPAKKVMLAAWGPPDQGEYSEYILTAKPEKPA